MSRIGKLPVPVPSGVEVSLDDRLVTVKGPKGTLSHTVAEPITVAKGEDGSVEVKRPNDERESRSLHGLTRTLIANMVTGVTDGYEKKLEIVGVGYRVLSKGPTQLEFQLGYSHPITYDAPDGISFTVDGPTKLGVVTFARSEANQALAAHWGELRTVTGTRFGAIWTLRPTNLLCLLGDGIPTSQPSLSSVASSLATIPADNCFTR